MLRLFNIPGSWTNQRLKWTWTSTCHSHQAETSEYESMKIHWCTSGSASTWLNVPTYITESITFCLYAFKKHLLLHFCIDFYSHNRSLTNLCPPPETYRDVLILSLSVTQLKSAGQIWAWAAETSTLHVLNPSTTCVFKLTSEFDRAWTWRVESRWVRTVAFHSHVADFL